MSQLFSSDNQNTGASASFLPTSIQGWFSLRLTVWSPCYPRDFQESSLAPQFEGINSLVLNLLYGSTLTSIHDCWKTIALITQTFVGKILSLLLNMLSRLVIGFLPRSKRLLISWLQSPSTVILKPKKIKSVTVSIVSPSICHEVMELADGDCSHEIKRCLLLWKKVMTNLDSILKSRDITLPTKVHLVKAMVCLVVMYGCQSWTIKKAECQRIGASELWCWRRLWESLGQQGDPTSHPKGNQSWIFIARTDAEAEAPILWPPDAKN